MEPDEMSEQPPGRRWGDIENAIRIAVIQAMTEVRLTIDRLDKRQEVLWNTIFGNPEIEQPGVVKRMSNIEGKLDRILDTHEQREADWKKMREFLEREEERQAVQSALSRYIKRYGTLVSVLAGIMTIIAFLQIVGVINLGGT